jgi:hypothetical protein
LAELDGFHRHVVEELSRTKQRSGFWHLVIL